MSTPAPTPALSPVLPRRRRRWRIVLAALALLIGVPLLYWGYTAWSTHAAWEEAEAEAALDLPRWKLTELEADRPQIADEDNAALHINAVRRKGGGPVAGAKNYEKIFENLPPNAQLNSQQLELLKTELAKIAGPVAEARKLKDMPRGRFPITLADNFICTLIPDHQEARRVMDWLQHDAMLLAEEGETDKAIDSCRAILTAGRSFQDDPFLMAVLIRLAFQNASTVTLERVLAQGPASEASLVAMQVALDREIKETPLVNAMRGERAGYHHLFENIRAGKVEAGWLSMGMRMNVGNTWDNIELWLADRYPSTALKSYPELLRLMNRAVEISKKPYHERAPLMKDWEADLKKIKNPIARLFLPGLATVSQREGRMQALMRSALVAVACERYRLRHAKHDWPAALDDLVKAKLLDVIPADPFDGQPMRYRRTKEGIVVYSVGFDLADNNGKIDRERVMDAGVDIGFRLWNVDRRRQDPMPEVALPD
ncbi:MAG: hypothetical protein HY289_11595 [Planctomycetes bacterium]|nr:hypothetical protein [Planctomycetota bacterium]